MPQNLSQFLVAFAMSNLMIRSHIQENVTLLNSYLYDRPTQNSRDIRIYEKKAFFNLHMIHTLLSSSNMNSMQSRKANVLPKQLANRYIVPQILLGLYKYRKSLKKKVARWCCKLPIYLNRELGHIVPFNKGVASFSERKVIIAYLQIFC